eukprot:scpid44178/ scgid9524/ E3 ubiquitin-protein ligase TRIM33; Ectodermin homolog; Transcription intermediary factor 1-gamma; Tripartite motif-containing protein 33
MSQQLSCVSCGSNTRRLKLVSCLHPVCVACLEPRVQFDGSVQCPKCSINTSMLAAGSSLVAILPDSHPKRSKNRLSKNEATTASAAMCDDCAEDESATGSCADCGMNLCDVHAAGHPRSRSSHNHRVVPLSDGQEETATASMDPCSTRHYCGIHPRQVLSKYCVQCEQVTCQRCLDTGAHRGDGGDTQHQLLSIEEAAQNMRDAVNQNIRGCVSDSDGVIHTALEKVQHEMSNLYDDTEFASKEITDHFHYLRELLDAREKVLLEEVDQQRNSKLVELEAQIARLQDGLRHGQAVSEISQSCADDTDFLKMARWLNSAISQRKDVTRNDGEPCCRSQIVFCTVNVEDAAEAIKKVGAVQDFITFFGKDATLSVEDAYVDADLKIVENFKRAPPRVSEDFIAHLGLQISVHREDNEEVPTTPLQQVVAPDRLVSKCVRLTVTGKLTVSVQHRDQHLQGSPMLLNVTHYIPTFDEKRCHSNIRISNSGRTVSRGNHGDSTKFRSVCTSSIPTRYGTSSIRLRLDTCPSGSMHFYVGLCLSTAPQLDTLHRIPGEIFGWWSYDPQHQRPWQQGGVICLEVNHDENTLACFDECTRTRSVREIGHVTSTSLCWYFTLGLPRMPGTQLQLTIL